MVRLLPKPKLKFVDRVSPADIELGMSVDENTFMLYQQISAEAEAIDDAETRELWMDALQSFARDGDVSKLLSVSEWRRKVCDIEEFILSPFYLGMDRAELYDAVLDACIELDGDDYIEACLKGCIGSGKSTIANIMLARGLYKLSCMRHPQTTFGIQSKSSIAFTIQSVRLTTAKKAVFEELGNYINKSPYFKNVYPYDQTVTSQMIFREQNIFVLPVSSSSTGAISMNVIGGILDECLVGETAVTTPDGDTPLYKLEPGDNVLASDNGTLIWDTVLEKRFMGVKPCIRVEFNDGSILIGTNNHPVDTGAGWVALGDLEIGSDVNAARYSERPRSQGTKTAAANRVEPNRSHAQAIRAKIGELQSIGACEDQSIYTSADQSCSVCEERREQGKGAQYVPGYEQYGGNTKNSVGVEPREVCSWHSPYAHTRSKSQDGIFSKREKAFTRDKSETIHISHRIPYAREEGLREQVSYNREQTTDRSSLCPVKLRTEIYSDARGEQSSNFLDIRTVPDTYEQRKSHGSRFSRKSVVWRNMVSRNKGSLCGAQGARKISSHAIGCNGQRMGVYTPHRKRIVSIEHSGLLPVWNIETARTHTYVANGTVTHNCNYMQKIEKSKSSQADMDTGLFDQAKQLYITLSRRRRSRFTRKGKLPGTLFLVSSSRYPDDFTEKKASESTMCGGDDPKIYVYSHSQWSAKGRAHFLPESFRVQVGTDKVRSKILEPGDLAMHGATVIEVPMDFYSDFSKDVDGALRDFAGITVLATHPFFGRREAIFACMEEGEKNGYKLPFNIEEVDLSIGFPKPIIERLRTDVDSFRIAHVDLGLRKDAAGIAIGHIAGTKMVERRGPGDEARYEIMPVIGIDMLLRVRPPPGGEIEFALIRDLLKRLRDVYGIPIKYVTFDGFQCISGNTNIWTARGMMPASDVIEGDIVQSRIGARPVTKKWSFGKQAALRITTNDGHEITVTEGHKLEVEVARKWVYKEGQRGRSAAQLMKPIWGWKEARKLKVGDRVHAWDGNTEVVGQNSIALKQLEDSRAWSNLLALPDNLTPTFARLLGIIWGDGYIHRDSVKITVTPEDEKDACAIVEAAIGYKPKVINKTGVKGAYDVLIQSRDFVRFLKLNGLYKFGRRFPDLIQQSNRYVQAAFLSGLFATDGSVKARDGQPSYNTKHLGWAHYVQDFMRMAFGIESCLTKSKRMGNHYRTDSEYQYIVSVRGSREKFSDKIGFAYSSKQDQLERHLAVPGRNMSTRIISIEPTEADVYDFEVAEDHAYLANGLVSHNSIDSRQILKKQGFLTEYQSVEKVEPWRALRDAIYDHRVLMPRHNFVLKELTELETQIVNNKEKVDHRPQGSKDVADALCGVVNFLLSRRAAWAGMTITGRTGTHLLGDASRRIVRDTANDKVEIDFKTNEGQDNEEPKFRKAVARTRIPRRRILRKPSVKIPVKTAEAA